jgi:hypothetical protein
MINGAFITSGFGWSGLIQTSFNSDVLHVKRRVHQINHGSFPWPAFTMALWNVAPWHDHIL